MRIPAFAAVAFSGAGLALLVACDFDEACSVRAGAVLASVPRTAWAVSWGVRSGLAYVRCMVTHSDRGSEEYRHDLALLHGACARRLLRLCQSNGGVYVKAAQLLSTAQTVPAEYRTALEVLQDQAEPRPYADVELAIQRELGLPIGALFVEFEPEARAAASLAQARSIPSLCLTSPDAQVHKARLADGREVAVKVQYLGLETAVNADFTTLSLLADAAARFFPDSFDFGWVLTELRQNLAKELDFRLEAANAQRLAAAFAGRRGVAVPLPVPELSGERVLTMEWIDGCKLTDMEALVAMRVHPHDVALELLHAFAQMTFVDGFGFWYRWFGGQWQEPQLVLLDHGLIVEIPDALRQQYCQLWCSFVLNDQATAAAVATQIAGERGGELLPKLLRPGALRSEEQRRALRSQAGVSSIGDLGRLLEGLPRPLVDFLKVSAITRGAATKLGSSVPDRLRINATYALKGMSICRLPGGRVQYEGSLQSRRRRLRISVSIRLLRCYFWLSSTARQMWQNLSGQCFGHQPLALPLVTEWGARSVDGASVACKTARAHGISWIIVVIASNFLVFAGAIPANPTSFNLCGTSFNDASGIQWYGKSFIVASSIGASCINTTNPIVTTPSSCPAPNCIEHELQEMLQISETGVNLTYNNIGIGSIGLINTNFQVTLYFAEYVATAVGQRVFDIVINGATVATDVDVFALAGGQDRAVSLNFLVNSGSIIYFNIFLPTKVGPGSIFAGVSFGWATKTSISYMPPSFVIWGAPITLQAIVSSLNPSLGNITEGAVSFYIDGVFIGGSMVVDNHPCAYNNHPCIFHNHPCAYNNHSCYQHSNALNHPHHDHLKPPYNHREPYHNPYKPYINSPGFFDATAHDWKIVFFPASGGSGGGVAPVVAPVTVTVNVEGLEANVALAISSPALQFPSCTDPVRVVASVTGLYYTTAPTGAVTLSISGLKSPVAGATPLSVTLASANITGGSAEFVLHPRSHTAGAVQALTGADKSSSAKLLPGSYQLTAAYSGNALYGPATGSASLDIDHACAYIIHPCYQHSNALNHPHHNHLKPPYNYPEPYHDPCKPYLNPCQPYNNPGSRHLNSPGFQYAFPNHWQGHSHHDFGLQPKPAAGSAALTISGEAIASSGPPITGNVTSYVNATPLQAHD
ncbi:ABC1-domain-containing protein [Coccomyxa subellipsoidea C-169]|uniref:ABC1-domain-containing protein n=1 Tax=Coccomyxa subellipsoidea (strain C-169) TaxID=574566 RepID=I0Z1B5_COCSC|nr:ABC1-domain-containing protein [Coccomyxa subellipsoidea C-169]EIE24434.1 ABC1-domain-containing protein [Coccomyxa subellipsoidea C-169]|eukprot:XP_005648978.1 ABC1-domain-containing protein [Coccomyxa subellipsoidea C-169]